MVTTETKTHFHMTIKIVRVSGLWVRQQPFSPGGDGFPCQANDPPEDAHQGSPTGGQPVLLCLKEQPVFQKFFTRTVCTVQNVLRVFLTITFLLFQVVIYCVWLPTWAIVQLFFSQPHSFGRQTRDTQQKASALAGLAVLQYQVSHVQSHQSPLSYFIVCPNILSVVLCYRTAIWAQIYWTVEGYISNIHKLKKLDHQLFV